MASENGRKEQEYRERYQQQINELFRLAAEAESCAKLLRQEAERYQKLLDEGEIEEAALKGMLEERESLRFNPEGTFKITEGLM